MRRCDKCFFYFKESELKQNLGNNSSFCKNCLHDSLKQLENTPKGEDHNE